MAAVEPHDRVLGLLKGLELGSQSRAAEVGELVQRLYAELKEHYEAQGGPTLADDTVDQAGEDQASCTQACLLFVGRVLAAAQLGDDAAPAHLHLPITKIVSAAGINVLDFFRELHVVVSKLSGFLEARGSSARLFPQQSKLKENAETVLVLGLLVKKYKDFFNLFLHQLDSLKQVVLRLGWVAFLVLKSKLLSPFPDLVSCVELLPCIFTILVSHASRLPDCLGGATGKKLDSAELLKGLSDACRTDYSRVVARMPHVEALLTQFFTNAVPEWRVTAQRPLELSDGAAKGPAFEGLMTNLQRMNQAVAALEREYEQHYGRGATELDERDFLATDFSKFASPRISPAALQSAFTSFQGRGPNCGLRQGGALGPGAHMAAPSQPLQQLPLGMLSGLGAINSPLPMMHLGGGPGQPGTPVSELMGAAAWLRGITSNLAAEPSQALVRHLQAMPSATTAAQQLAKRVREMVSAVIPEDTAPSLLSPFPLVQPSLAAERRTEAVKLYYYSLDTIVALEEKVGGPAAVQALLGSTKFHRGLVACCVEVVAACYRMVSCAFPKVLDVLRLKAFDLSKMIHSFVRSVATLPRDLKRHMFLIEEKILESLAWEPGSTLYHIITQVVNEPQLQPQPSVERDSQGDEPSPQQQQQQGDGAAAMDIGTSSQPPADSASHQQQQQGPMAMDADQPGSTAAAAAAAAHAPPPSPKRTQSSAFSAGLMSPAKRARGEGGAHSTAASSEPFAVAVGLPPSGIKGPLPGGQAGVLYEFLRKVLKLTAFRLQLLCENFDFSPLDRAEVVAKVYETIEHALYQQTSLYYNRHIDQIMLSALYGYCKVHKLSQVSFREIITHYRKQPQAQQPIFRSVVIEQSNPGLVATSPRADIISFYNQVFVPAMKVYLLKAEASASDSHAATGGGLPPLPPSRAASASPRAHPKLPPLSSVTATRSGSAALLSSRGGVSVLGSHGLEHPGLEPSSLAAPPPAATTSSCPNTPSNGGAADGAAGKGLPPRPGRSKSQTQSQDHKIPGGLAALLQALDSQQAPRQPAAAPAAAAGGDAAPAEASGSDGRNRSTATSTEGGQSSSASRGSPSMHNAAQAAGRGGGGGQERGEAADMEGVSVQTADAAGGAGAGQAAEGGRRRTPNRRYLDA